MLFCLQLFLVLLIHHYHFALETFSIHLWVIFTFAPWDRHNHFQIASIPSLLGRFSPNSSRQPHAISISHDDLRRRRFDTQVDAILPTCTSISRVVLLLAFFSTRFLQQMPCLALLLICPSVSRTRSSHPVQPRTLSTGIPRVLRFTAKWNASHQSSPPHRPSMSLRIVLIIPCTDWIALSTTELLFELPTGLFSMIILDPLVIALIVLHDAIKLVNAGSLSDFTMMSTDYTLRQLVDVRSTLRRVCSRAFPFFSVAPRIALPCRCGSDIQCRVYGQALP